MVGHMQLAATAQSGGPGVVKSYLILWGPFILWTMELLAGDFSRQLLLWHKWRGGEGVPCLPKDWPGERIEEDSCHYLLFSKECAVCPGAGHPLRCIRGLLPCQVIIVTSLPPALVSPDGGGGW